MRNVIAEGLYSLAKVLEVIDTSDSEFQGFESESDGEFCHIDPTSHQRVTMKLMTPAIY